MAYLDYNLMVVPTVHHGQHGYCDLYLASFGINAVLTFFNKKQMMQDSKNYLSIIQFKCILVKSA